jgi:hypothetical protein
MGGTSNGLRNSRGLRLSRLAAADLSALQYTFVKVDTRRANTLHAARAMRRLGYSAGRTPTAGASKARRCTMASAVSVVDGSGTAIAAMDYLKSDSSGRGVKTTTNGDEVGAQALEAATTANAIIAVRVVRFRY